MKNEKQDKRKYESGGSKRSKKKRELLLQCANDKNQSKINFFSDNKFKGKCILKLNFLLSNLITCT